MLHLHVLGTYLVTHAITCVICEGNWRATLPSGEQNRNCQGSTDWRPGLFFSFFVTFALIRTRLKFKKHIKEEATTAFPADAARTRPLFIPVWTGPGRTLRPVQNCELQRRPCLQNSISLWPVVATAPVCVVHLFLKAFSRGPPEVTFGKVCGIFPVNSYS